MIEFDDDGLDEMEADILAAAEGILDIGDYVYEFMQMYADEVRRNAPRDTGQLKRSIRAVTRGNMYGISMEYYGYF